jgi:enoyl-CoA hydratase/carnithine racemase
VSERPVLFEARHGVGWITLNRPRVLNALDTALVAALSDAVERAATDPELTVVVVRGAGRAFCSGMDRAALGAGTVSEPFFRHWIRALNMLEDMSPVTLAVLHGYSIGGGLQLALACDLRLAATDAVIGLGATRHGIIPDGAVLRLARMVGLGRAKELALLNEDVPAAEARALGLVSRVVAPADLERAVTELIDKTRQASSTANAHAKRLLHASFHRDPRGMIEEVMEAQSDCMASWETAEANRAWQERREARFYPPPAR